MMNNIVPSCLSSLVPPNVGSASRYSLRNADNLQTINAKTNLYSNSFLPSEVRNWNNLPAESKQIDSLVSFKQFLTQERQCGPKYCYTGKRLPQILHTRLRTNSSNLNYNLLSKHIIDSPLCSCGSIENTYHFFFECHMYAPQRILLENIATLP